MSILLNRTTGAGGANVFEYGYLMQMDSDDFPALPFQDLEHGNSNFRVGWRQQVRNGKNAGKIIEDYGIYSDYVIRPRTTDITDSHSTNSSSQLDRIIHVLSKKSHASGRKFVYCILY